MPWGAWTPALPKAMPASVAAHMTWLRASASLASAIARTSLADAGLDVVLYDEVRVEPTDESFYAAARFAGEADIDGFVSVGGGSVIDTCKAANL